MYHLRLAQLGLVLLLLAACTDGDLPTQPLNAGDAVEQSLESAESDSYVATVLPDGILSERTHLVLDDNGGVLGSVVHGSGTDRAAKWTADASGNVTGPDLLGTLPEPFDRADQYVRSVSKNGDVVVGYARNSGPTAGWVWVNGAITVLLPVPDHGRVIPMAINDAGVIVGQVGTSEDGVFRDWGAVWLPPYDAEPIFLPRMEGYSLNSAREITNEGVITGWVRGGNMVDALVQWEIDAHGNVLGGPVKLEGIDQVLMGAANQDRDVVGSFHGNDQWEPYLFRSATGHHIALERLGGHTAGHAIGVTDRSPDDGSVRAVGRSWTRGASDHRAVLWGVDASGTVVGPFDLGMPPAMVTRTRGRRTYGFVSAAAVTINSQGWVAGWSEREDGTFFATLWQPNDNGGDDGGDDDCRPHPRTGECR